VCMRYVWCPSCKSVCLDRRVFRAHPLCASLLYDTAVCIASAPACVVTAAWRDGQLNACVPKCDLLCGHRFGLCYMGESSPPCVQLCNSITIVCGGPRGELRQAGTKPGTLDTTGWPRLSNHPCTPSLYSQGNNQHTKRASSGPCCTNSQKQAGFLNAAGTLPDRPAMLCIRLPRPCQAA
jgi:hypothetical protein